MKQYIVDSNGQIRSSIMPSSENIAAHLAINSAKLDNNNQLPTNMSRNKGMLKSLFGAKRSDNRLKREHIETRLANLCNE